MNWLTWAYTQLLASLIKTRDTIISKESVVKPVVLSQSSETIIQSWSLNTNNVTTMPETVSKIHMWALAISVQEGAKKSLNNPGNLKLSTLTKSWGATAGFTAEDGGIIAQFPTPQAGETALENFLTLGCEDELIAFHSPEARTLGGFTQIFAGNPAPEYGEAVARALGCTLETQISSFI